MQTLYIADFPLPGERDATWRSAEATVSGWTEGRLGLDLGPEASEGTNPDLGTFGRSLAMAGADGSRLRLWNTRKVDPARPLWAYDVTAWLWSAPDAGPADVTLRVRLAAHALHGLVAELPELPAAPGLVRDVLDTHEVLGDGRRLGHPWSVGVVDVPDLFALLTDGGRRRPVLVLTPSPATGKPLVEPTRTARRLAGLAHVAVLNDRSVSAALLELLGSAHLSAFGGAARLFWPGFSIADDRGAHPLWLPERLARGGPLRFADLLFARLGRLSALTLGPPELESRLRREAEAATRARAAAASDLLTTRYNEALRELEAAKATAVVGSSAEESAGEEWFAEYEKTLEELEQTASERDDLQIEVDQLQERLRVADGNIRAMALASIAGPRQSLPAEEEELETEEEPDSVRHAVELAASSCPHLEFLPEAFSSAGASEFKRPRQVLDDLRALERVAGLWARDELGAGGFEAALVEAGVSGFRSGISSTAQTQYAKDYERDRDGSVIMLGPHIARGVGAPAAIMRIYWYVDADSKVLVVGHVGRKLRDDSNPG